MEEHKQLQSLPHSKLLDYGDALVRGQPSQDEDVGHKGPPKSLSLCGTARPEEGDPLAGGDLSQGLGGIAAGAAQEAHNTRGEKAAGLGAGIGIGIGTARGRSGKQLKDWGADRSHRSRTVELRERGEDAQLSLGGHKAGGVVVDDPKTHHRCEETKTSIACRRQAA